MSITRFVRRHVFDIGDEKIPTNHPKFKMTFYICMAEIVCDINKFCSSNEIKHYDVQNADLNFSVDGCDCAVNLLVEISHDKKDWHAI